MLFADFVGDALGTLANASRRLGIEGIAGGDALHHGVEVGEDLRAVAGAFAFGRGHVVNCLTRDQTVKQNPSHATFPRGDPRAWEVATPNPPVRLGQNADDSG